MPESHSGKLPVTVIGGYLGAGKTSLLNNLLRQANGRRLALLVNDFGDINIDADLIEAGDDQLLQLAGGCVCCSMGSDLVSALADLPSRIGDIDHVIIETSGVGLPGVVAATVGLSRNTRLDGILVVVNAAAVHAQLRDQYIADTIARQLSAANLLLVNQSDRLESAELTSVRALLATQAPSAVQIVTQFGELAIDLALERFDDNSIMPPSKFSAMPLRPANFVSLSFFSAPGSAVDLTALTQVLSARAVGITRAKGLIKIADQSVQTVQQVGTDVQTARWFRPPESLDTSRLLVIGTDDALDIARLSGELAKLGMWPSTDAPLRSGRTRFGPTDNPQRLAQTRHFSDGLDPSQTTP